MTITIEQLQLDELKAFLRVQADDAFPGLKDQNRLNVLAEKWHKYAEFCTCRDEGGQLVGMIAFYANQPLGGVIYIPHVYVSKNYRGKGAFTYMFVQIKQYATNKGFSLIRLEVQKDNIKAQRSYLNNGFQIDRGASKKTIYMQCKI